METIRNYLETMFANMPNTPEVLQAKRELLQMMEDKYNELTGDGMSENEAIGKVISEFGNIDDIAEELGLNSNTVTGAAGGSNNNNGNGNSDNNAGDAYNNAAGNFGGAGNVNNGGYYGGAPKRHVTLQEAKSYFSSRAVTGILIGIGVFFCIISVVMPIIGSAIDFRGDFAAYSDNLFVSLMFVLIAIGVGFFIIAGVKDSKWNYIKQESCYIDYSTAEYIRNEKERFSVLYAIMLVIGIIMCIISVIPPIMTSSIKFIVGGVNIEELSAAGMFCIVGVGVFFIVVASTLSGRYDKLLKLVNSQGIPGSGNDKDEVHYENKTLALIMSLYWPTVTSIYLIWSFVTFKWYITWIIWPIAGIINKVIESNLGTKNNSGYSNDYRGNTTAYRVILTIITVGLIIFGVFGRFSFHFPFGINIGGFLGGKTVTKDIAVNDFENITLDMSIGDVTIEHGDSYKIWYSFPETMLPDIESKDGMLTVSTKDGKAGLLDFFGHKNGTMTITIPENVSLQSIHADLNMGNIKFSEIDIAGGLELDADMGNIEIIDSDIGTAKCEADMGNIELTKIKAKEVTLDADMGSIEISGTVSSLISECSMGSIRFDPDNEITDEHISLKTDMGSVKVGGKDYGRSFNNH